MILGSNWRWPDIAGLHDFKGKLLHSASWDDSYDFRDKTVAVIGSGSSAIQIVPQLQPSKSA
jgi:cation diffusion facilitator CzcD-associated flavoprotein CzcO